VGCRFRPILGPIVTRGASRVGGDTLYRPYPIKQGMRDYAYEKDTRFGRRRSAENQPLAGSLYHAIWLTGPIKSIQSLHVLLDELLGDGIRAMPVGIDYA
jgi:hypothetical protein